MADTKISLMPAATALTGAEIVPIVQGGINAQTTLSAFKSLSRTVGSWQSNVTQTGSISAGTIMSVNIVDVVGGITANANAFTVPNTGVYNLQFSSQFLNTESTQEDIAIWVKINGTDVAGTAGVVTTAGRKNPSIPGKLIAGWNYFLNMTANQYVQIAWLPSSANVSMNATTATATYPAVASVIVTMNQVA
jgi:hypothetical protein